MTLLVHYILAVSILMVITALNVALVSWAFLDSGFWNGYSAAWDRPLVMLAFATVALMAEGRTIPSTPNNER